MTTKGITFTKLLLLCGAIAGPLFVMTVLIQDYTRSGFNPRLDMLSLLSLGSFGWIQTANFMSAGILNLCYALGLRRHLRQGPAALAAPLFIALYGVGLVAVSVFRTDPASGFPPGVAAATHPSWHGAIHALGALFVFIALAVALFTYVRFFFAQNARLWAWYCTLSSILFLAIFFAGFSEASIAARTLRLAVLIGWTANSLVAVKLLYISGGKPHTSNNRG